MSSFASKKVDDFTVESSSLDFASREATIPSTEVIRVKKSTSVSKGATVGSLLGAMEGAMKGTPSSRRPGSGFETSVLSAIAEGDDELVEAYTRLSVGESGKKELTAAFVRSLTMKSKIEIQKISRLIAASQIVSLCFLVDTTGSMESYIHAVKNQIILIVRQVQTSGCRIAGIAFVGYKDWCDGALFSLNTLDSKLVQVSITLKFCHLLQMFQNLPLSLSTSALREVEMRLRM